MAELQQHYTAIDPEAFVQMKAAFKTAIEARPDLPADVIAKRMMEAARAGEVQADRLAQAAIGHD